MTEEPHLFCETRPSLSRLERDLKVFSRLYKVHISYICNNMMRSRSLTLAFECTGALRCRQLPAQCLEPELRVFGGKDA